MPKDNQCKMEFYFSRDNIQKLLDSNPTAKGIIISQEIKVRRTSENQTINVIEIKACAAERKANATDSKSRSTPIEEQDDVDGCPEPPGCL